jgi:hypothetical protein
VGPVAAEFYRALDKATGRKVAAVWRARDKVVAPLNALVDILDGDTPVNAVFEKPGSVDRTKSNLAKAVANLDGAWIPADVARARAEVAAWTSRLAELQASNPGGYKRGSVKTRRSHIRGKSVKQGKSHLPRRDRHGRFVH